MIGQVVGLVGLIPEEREGELEPLVVSEPYRGRGIGKQLTKVVIEAALASGMRALKVQPVARNESAIGFFHGSGFNILGEIEMFMDFRPADRQTWKVGERVAGRGVQGLRLLPSMPVGGPRNVSVAGGSTR